MQPQPLDTMARGLCAADVGHIEDALQDLPQPRHAAGFRRRVGPLAAWAAVRATATRPRVLGQGRMESAVRAERRGLVDVALLAVMRDAPLRRSEAAALRWGDVEFHADGSARVHVRRSKADQEHAGAVLYLGAAAAAAGRYLPPRWPGTWPDRRRGGAR